jgi:hypothetical protein
MGGHISGNGQSTTTGPTWPALGVFPHKILLAATLRLTLGSKIVGLLPPSYPGVSVVLDHDYPNRNFESDRSQMFRGCCCDDFADSTGTDTRQLAGGSTELLLREPV